MAEMIRCVCGEVFDASVHSGCPACGRVVSARGAVQSDGSSSSADSASDAPKEKGAASKNTGTPAMPNWVWKLLAASVAVFLLVSFWPSSDQGEMGQTQVQMPSTQSSAEEIADSSSGVLGTCAGIVGKWSWFTGGFVSFRASGSAVFQPDLNGAVTVQGAWTCDKRTGNYMVNWSHGFSDTLQLSGDGNRLSGRNQQGAAISGQRFAK